MPGGLGYPVPLTADDVTKLVASCVQSAGGDTPAARDAAISQATSGFVTPQQLSQAVAGLASASSVSTAITNATSGLVTPQQLTQATTGLASTTAVTSAISNATSGLATAKSVTDAVAGLATSASVTALAATVPAPATAIPPGVAVAGDKGTAPRFALENHTHATSVQRARLKVITAGTAVRWMFATPYDTGIVPVCTATAENTSGATQPYVVNVVGTPTNTYCDYIVFKAQTQTLPSIATSLLGLVVNVFAPAPINVVINCQAAKATQ